MIIIYCKESGKVVNYPNMYECLQRLVDIELSHVIQEQGGSLDDYGVYCLDNANDLDLITSCYTHEYSIKMDKTGKAQEVVIGEPIPMPEPKPQLPTQEERIEALESAMLELVLGGDL